MNGNATLELPQGLLKAFLDAERFWPTEPRSLAETGISESIVEAMIFKHMAITGNVSGRSLSEQLCLPFQIVDNIVRSLRTRQLLVHAAAAPFNDFYYSLTELGRQQAVVARKSCAYIGPAPVTLADYVTSVEAQSINAEAPSAEELAQACQDISVDDQLLESLGPAVNSGSGIFLHGAPGNGKSTLAKRITLCFGKSIWIPYTLIEDGHLIKLFDAAYHEPAEQAAGPGVTKECYDRRWVRIRRPTVIVGGELTIDNLELHNDVNSNISEAPLQMKSNGGCLVIDDFGRQRISPAQLLNRWIVPLECRHDFLTLPTGKKLQVPFEQLIIFSTNIAPKELVDEAFLRRIPYKLQIADPSEAEFFNLFRLHAKVLGLPFNEQAVAYLIEKHYKSSNRAMRRCHARDLLLQVRNMCRYRRRESQMLPEYFDRAVESYFAALV